MDGALPMSQNELTQDPIEMSIQEVKAYLAQHPECLLIDVREDFELEICKLKASQQLTEALANEILSQWDRATRLIFYCHHGGRSRAAAEYFQQQGFSNVRNMTGGIDAWSQDIDPSVPRY